MQRESHDFHNQTHDTHEDAADNMVEQMGEVVEEFQGLIPELGQSVDTVIMDIRAQADRLIATRSAQLKRQNKEYTRRHQTKKPKNFKSPPQKGRMKQPQHPGTFPETKTEIC